VINLVKRTNADQLRKYFADDFVSSKWDVVGRSLGTELEPTRTLLRPSYRRCPDWTKIDETSFGDIVAGLEKLAQGGILAFELDFSPPKSVSVAALAGQSVCEEIIRHHMESVNDSLVFLAPVMLDRRMKKGDLRFLPAAVGLIRFTHPWNYKREPQLHSHVLLHRVVSPASRAIYAYPLYLLQRALRAVYHFALASRLRQAGYRLRLGEPGSLAWELDGIKPAVLRAFAERSAGIAQHVRDHRREGYFSRMVETRIAAASTRRALPKTESGATLATARKLWEKKIPARKCVAATSASETGQSDWLPVPLDTMFRRGSVISRWQFTATHLAQWLGAPVSVTTALDAADRIRDMRLRQGEVVEKDRGLCLPKVFQAEAEILAQLADGYDRREPIIFKLPPGGSTVFLAKRLLEIGEPSDRVRLASLFGEILPRGTKAADPKGNDISTAIIALDQWDPFVALSEIRRRSPGYAVVVARDVLHKGDFLERIARLIPRKKSSGSELPKPRWRGAQVSVLNETMENVLAGKKRFWQTIQQKLGALWKSKKKPVRSSKLPIIFNQRLAAHQCQEASWHRLAEITAGSNKRQEVALREVVPWDELFVAHRWEGKGIFLTASITKKELTPFLRSYGFEEEQTLRYGDLWEFVEAPVANVFMARSLKRPRWFSLPVYKAIASFPEFRDRIHLVSTRKVFLVPGVPLASMARFKKLNPGEIAYVERMRKDGTIIMSNRTKWSPRTCVLRPALVVNEFAPKQGTLARIVMGLAPDEDIIRLLAAIPKCNSAVVLSHSPAVVESTIREEIEKQNQRRHRAVVGSALSQKLADDPEDPAFFLPPRNVFAALIKNQHEPVDFSSLAGFCKESPAAVAPKQPVPQSRPTRPVASVIDPVITAPIPGPTTALIPKPRNRQTKMEELKRIQPPAIAPFSFLWRLLFMNQANLMKRSAASRSKARQKALPAIEITPN